jgi:hypothetical protein
MHREWGQKLRNVTFRVTVSLVSRGDLVLERGEITIKPLSCQKYRPPIPTPAPPQAALQSSRFWALNYPNATASER